MRVSSSPETLIVRNIGFLVTMDPSRSILRNGYVVARDGWITDLGTGDPAFPPGARIVDAKGGIVLPGLINTHHHMLQSLVRAYPPGSDQPLYGWLKHLAPLWWQATPEHLFWAAQVAMAELMLSGCTLTVDHHYVFTGGNLDWMDRLFESATLLGIRLHAARGAMDTGSEIYADWAIQPIGEILNDFDRVAAIYDDPAAGSFRRVALAPTAILSASSHLYREAARYAEAHHLRLHTHCGETPAEIERTKALFGLRPIEVLFEAGWETDRVWVAHGIHFSDPEITRIGSAGIGIAHCPCSNMRLGSGICPVDKLFAAGARVSLGVDGSASNDSGHLLAEARQALLLARVARGAGAMKVQKALELATIEGAACLGRSADLGTIEKGKCADLAIFPEVDLFSSGAVDPIQGLVLCFPRKVETLIIHGKVRVDAGQIVGFDLESVLEKQRAIAAKFVDG